MVFSLVQRHLRKLILTIVFPLGAACAGDAGNVDSLDWSKAQSYDVTTRGGDRVSTQVVGNEKEGFDYFARIRHMTRTNPDPLDRQRVLKEAMQRVAHGLCGDRFEQTRPVFASDNYEQRGRIACTET